MGKIIIKNFIAHNVTRLTEGFKKLGKETI